MKNRRAATDDKLSRELVDQLSDILADVLVGDYLHERAARDLSLRGGRSPELRRGLAGTSAPRRDDGDAA